jgi:hypothetical protein
MYACKIDLLLFFFAEIYDEAVVCMSVRKKNNYFIILNDTLYHTCHLIKYSPIRLCAKVKAEFSSSLYDTLAMYAQMHISSILLFLSIQSIFFIYIPLCV